MVSSPASALQPMIVKYTQHERNGIQAHCLTRHCIGYVVRGRKYIYSGDVRHPVGSGQLFYLGLGNHYTEDMPEAGKGFEQIAFYYTSEELARILNHLTLNFKLDIRRDHACPACENRTHVIVPGWGIMQSFFLSVNHYLKDNFFSENRHAECIKITELIYLILSQPGNCLKNKILNNSDLHKENFEQIVMKHLFTDISSEELARKCNRSLTSFKKDFQRHFNEPPHRWFIRQRLTHARLLLISTNKSIFEVGIECRFPNTSHFIKLYKKEFGVTPGQYRSRESPETIVQTAAWRKDDD